MKIGGRLVFERGDLDRLIEDNKRPMKAIKEDEDSLVRDGDGSELHNLR